MLTIKHKILKNSIAEPRRIKKLLGSESGSESAKISTRQMESILESLKSSKHQPSTKYTYSKIWQKFNKFVIRLDRIPKKWEQRVSLYCGYIIDVQHLKSTTVKSYISAIKDTLVTDGYPWSDDDILLNTITRSCKLKNDVLKTRLPIRKNLLEVILYQLQRKFSKSNQPYLEIMYITAFLLFYYGMLRVGELANSQHAIKAKDIHSGKRKNKILMILYSSKTHSKADIPQTITIQDEDIIEVHAGKQRSSSKNKLPHQFIQETNFCPFLWTNRYLTARGGYLHKDEQFLIFSDGSPVEAGHIRKLLRQTLNEIGLQGTLYDVHSFRIGRATDLQKGGISVTEIKELGRWKSNSVYKYLRKF